MTLLTVVKEANDIFATYGWPGLIVLIALTIGYFGLQKLFKDSKSHTNSALEKGFTEASMSLSSTIKEQNEKILDAFISQSEKNTETMKDVMMEVLNKKSSNDQEIHAENIKKRMDISYYVKRRVHDLFKEYNCDRAFILELHNSKQNLSGLSFVWYDMIYEDVARGYNTLQNTYKDQEASQLLPIIKKVNENGGFAHYTIEELEEFKNNSTALYHRLRIERNLTECVILGLYSSDNALIGLLVLEYEDSMLPVEVFDIDNLIAEANAISSLLDCSSSFGQKNCK